MTAVSMENIPVTKEGFKWTPDAGFTQGLPTPAVIASNATEDLSTEYDVIVIGAGFAGLASARDLALKGHKVLIVEARDRIGGRTWTAHTDQGKLEIGGTWVHWVQPHVYSELRKYGLDKFLVTDSHPEGCEVMSKPNRAEPASTVPSERAEQEFGQMEALLAKFMDIDQHGGKSVIPFPFDVGASVAANPDYLVIDRLSIADRVEQLEDISDGEREALKDYAASFFGTPPEAGSFTEVLHTFALSQFNPQMIEESTMKFKIAAGTTALALAILDDYEGDRLLSSPVTKITQDGGPYPITISTKSGLKFKAKKAISTIPMNILSSIEFQPPLSDLQRGAITTGITPARTDKLLCKTSLDLSTGFSISCEGGDMPFSSGFVDGKDEDQTLVLLAHPDVSLGEKSDIIKMVETLRPGGLPVTSAYASLWSEDPFAGGVMPSKQAGEGELEWGVATGTVMCLSGQASAPASYSSHQHIVDTKDGGLSIWMRELGNPSDDHESSTYENSTDETLQASCACGNVKFHVTRPNDSSRVPKRNFPDLMFADKTTPDEFKKNVGDEKWWIQDAGQKYLAGTCACRSCRLVSGYEIQTWAFVPRTNIFFHAPDADGERIIPLDFNTLPPGILTTYTSSSNVGREFCGTCGASVFWHQKDPDDVIDISVGLLRAPEGARAENWLKWWRGRVSFVEDVDYKRDGLEAKTASQLIHMLEKGMQEAQDPL
ncbi:hypothetical protein NM208_g9593 [Fusarium decemcellulare]|uniref:Uncharacterized protein n=1 Tax=Fusarium decemcellulare TaxID=57161 RepID=A0ACC1S182_9HYPO|nr:hypothetical protein NM208_g9593 [Fusarium decemcellulare]